MKNRYQILFFFCCICLCSLSLRRPYFCQPPPLSASTRPFESDTLVRPDLLSSPKPKYLFLEEHRASWPLFSLGTGSMHSGADAVAFPQGDGCCGVYKATWWHLHKEEWMLLGPEGKKRGGSRAVGQRYHPIHTDAPWQSFCPSCWGT